MNVQSRDRRVVQDCFRGALVGTFVGDALGAPVEAETRYGIQWDYGRLTDFVEGCGLYTDDTQMMTGLAEALVADNGALNEETVAAAFADNFDDGRGYGENAARILGAIRSGVSWPQAVDAFKPPGGSFGNGAAMRVAPISVALFPARDHAIAGAIRQAAVTGHTHPLGAYGAHMQAAAVHAALSYGCAQRAWDGAAVLDQLAAEPMPDDYANAIRWMRAQSTFDAEATIKNLGNGVRAHRSVPTSFWVFHKHWEDPEAAVIEAVNLGGDTDTIAAMTGAIAGAYHGMSAFPKRWLEGLERGPKAVDHVVALADRLFALHCSRP